MPTLHETDVNLGELTALLSALTALKKGKRGVRLQVEWIGVAGKVAVIVVSSIRAIAMVIPAAVTVGSAPDWSNRLERTVSAPPLHCCVGETEKLGGLGSALLHPVRTAARSTQARTADRMFLTRSGRPPGRRTGKPSPS